MALLYFINLTGIVANMVSYKVYIMRVIFSMLVVVLLSGCQSTPTYVYQTSGTYNPDEVSWSKLDGDSSVSGSAFIRQRNGGIVSCAGFEVELFPQSSYADERLSYLYSNLNKGFNTSRAIDTGDHRYLADGRKTICGVDGKFKFTNLPNGVYYIITQVAWQVGYSTQGARLFQKVDLTSGGNLEVVLSM